MKTLIVPDLHGKNIWSKIIKEDNFDKIVFLGDYVDCFGADRLKMLAQGITSIEITLKTIKDDIFREAILLQQMDSYRYALKEVTDNFVPNTDIIRNLVDLIDFKKKNSDKVTLLLGNHDLHYIENIAFTKSGGYNEDIAKDLKKLYNKNIDLFTIAETVDDFLLTHAGISEKYLTKYNYSFNSNSVKTQLKMEYLDFKNNKQLYLISNFNGGMDEFSGPFWQRPPELKNQQPLPFWQIVGHTPFEKPTFDFNKKMVYADCLNKTSEFLVLNNGSLTTIQWKQ